MQCALLSSAKFLWVATAGHRLRPWQSPYLRWRVETYTGIPASSLRLRDFTRMAWLERRQLLQYFVWVGRLDRLAQRSKR